MLLRFVYVISLLLIAFLSSGCHVARFFYFNFADIHDHKKFPAAYVPASSQPFHFTELPAPIANLPNEVKRKDRLYSFERALRKSGTVAFLVIRRDTILYEKYFHSYKTQSVVPSFSVAKSFVSALVGFAVQDGFIGSVQDPITRYLPELNAAAGFDKITIEHVLDMRSGIRFVESYINPFGNVAKYYYGLNIKKYIPSLEIERPAGEATNYISVNTQLLSLIVERATNIKLNEYLAAKIWQPLGMEYDASWSMDSRRHQTIKAFCCLNARARDFAKFGRLYLNRGMWNGQQLLSADWVRTSTNFNRNRNGNYYSYQWWRVGRHYMADGILGQFIYVNTDKNIVIVRLGKRYGGIRWGQLFEQVAELN